MNQRINQTLFYKNIDIFFKMIESNLNEQNEKNESNRD